MGILSRRARSRVIWIIGALMVTTVLVVGVAIASHGDPVVDMTYSGAVEAHNGGVFLQGGAGAGTGNWDPFLTVQSNDPTESAYNTIKAEKQYDTFFGGGRTHPLSAAAVPAIDYEGGKYREFGLDANDQGSDTWMSIDTLEVFLATRPDVGSFDPLTSTFGNDPSAVKIYDNGDEPILMLSQGLESGSGVSDISLLLPDSLFPCEYGAPDCDLWIVLYTHYGAATFETGEVTIGESGENDAADYEWDVSAGFEEWSTQLIPVVFVEKTAEESFARTYDWEITKDVDPASVNLFAGESAFFDYLVNVDQTVTDSEFMVTGTVTITNPTGGDVISDSIPATITSITDELAGYGDVTLDCPGFSPGDTLGAGDTLECSYEISGAPLSAEFIGENVATVTLDFDGILFDYDGSAMVDFTGVEPTIIGYPEINVTDTNGGLGGAAGDFTWDYSLDQTCSSNPSDYTDGTYSFTHDNTATIDETGQNDSETVTVNCYAPVVSKDAAGSYDESHEWDITKSVDPTSQWGFAGDVLGWTWSVGLSEVSSEDNFSVAGDIEVFNAAPDAMTVLLSDVLNDAAATPGVISGCTGGAYSAGSLTIPAGGTATCAYEADPAGGTATLNTATATLNDIDFDAEAAVSFEVTVSDGSAVVDDLQEPDFPVTVFAGEGPWGWTEAYDHTCSSDFADYGSDGMYTVTINNLATVTGSDGAFDEAPASTTYTCYAPVVSKDAAGSYDESHEWDITKSVDPTSQWGFAGDVLGWTWSVGLSEVSSEDNFSVAGDIEVFNAAPDAMTVLLSDVLNDAAATPGVISGCTGGAYSAGSLTIPAGGTATCAYEADPAGGTATLNTATATLNDIDFDAEAAVSFEVTVSDGSAVVDDLQEPDFPVTVFAGEGPWGWTEAYDHTCSSDFADYGSDGMYTVTINNLATVTGSDGAFDEAPASTTYTCYAPVVSKDAAGSYDESHEWDITKSVDPTSQWGFAGDVLGWTWSVGLSEVSSEDNFSVAGDIEVFNAAPDAMTVLLSDVLNDAAATPGVISGCTGGAYSAGSLTIPAGGTATCAYEADPAGGTATLNTATATLNDIDFDAEAAVSFEVTVSDGSAVVDDLQEPDFPVTVFAGEGPWGWTEAYDHTCSSDFADYGSDGMYTVTINNLATVTGSDGAFDEAPASTTYTCYAPVVSKDADTEWFRDYTWDIAKDWDGSYSLNAGESVVHDYQVTVNQYIDDRGYRAFGSIGVFNAAPDPMTVLLSDELSDGTPVTISGCAGGVFAAGSLTIPAGNTATCAYTVDLPDDTDLTNWATATLNDIPFSAMAAVDFGDPIVSGYPSVNVDDTNGLTWFTSASNTWPYTKTFTCPTDESFYTDGVYTITHPNTATIRETGQSDDALVTVECTFPWEGLTPGYWKNHLDDWVGYSPDDLVKSVFVIPGTYMRDLGNATLLEALKWPAGDEVEEKAQVLLHHATAAVLNAAHPNISYPVSEAWIIEQVNLDLASGDPNVMLALKDQLDMYNNYGADINN